MVQDNWVWMFDDVFQQWYGKQAGWSSVNLLKNHYFISNNWWKNNVIWRCKKRFLGGRQNCASHTTTCMIFSLKCNRDMMQETLMIITLSSPHQLPPRYCSPAVTRTVLMNALIFSCRSVRMPYMCHCTVIVVRTHNSNLKTRPKLSRKYLKKYGKAPAQKA